MNDILQTNTNVIKTWDPPTNKWKQIRHEPSYKQLEVNKTWTLLQTAGST